MSNIILIQEQTVNELVGRFGCERLEECLIDNNISGTLEALTEGEGRAICRFKSFNLSEIESLRREHKEAIRYLMRGKEHLIID